MRRAGRLYAVVPAASRGERFGAAIPKQYVPLLGRPVLSWTLATLLAEPAESRRKRRVTRLSEATPGGSTQRSRVRSLTPLR